MKRYFSLIIILICIAIPLHAHAGVYNDVKSYVVRALSDISQWWSVKSISLTKEGEPQGGEPEGEPSEPAETAVPGMCRVAQQPPIIVCEQGSGFLCINTPEQSVSENSVIIKGTIDRAGSVPASIGISVQHEYTKRTSFVDTSNPLTSDCWTSTLDTKQFCLDEDGFYAAKVPLDDLGPYTIAIGATRFAGDSVTQTVRTSKVTALQMTDGSVAFEPDVRAGGTVTEPYVNVKISLLGDCQHCDFIGASTFGVTVTVENVMKDSSGRTSRISCATNVEQGGQGKFVVGVPVGPASNELTITACNAATRGSCPAIRGISFQGGGGAEGLDIISPQPEPSYSSSSYPTIPFQFKIPGIAGDTCVKSTLNRNQPTEVCPSGGVYSIDLNPQSGINVATIDNDELFVHFAWVFGWGDIASPFKDAGAIEDGLTSDAAVELVLPKDTVTDIIGPMISNALKSDELSEVIKKIGTGDSGEGEASDANETEIEIPMCGAESSLGDFKLTMVGDPSIGAAKVEGISFEKDVMRLSLNADNASFTIGLVKDAETVPLKISFLKVVIDLMLKADPSSGLIILGSPHTDCDYKSERYCTGMPAALVPKNMVGNATQYGRFVKCDPSALGSDVSDNVRELCDAMNSINSQTGIISLKILDAINSAIYCGGSKYLTGLVREGLRQKIKLEVSGVLGPVDLPAGFNLGGSLGGSLGSGIKIDEKGILLIAGLIAGDQELFSKIPRELQIPSVGVIANSKGPLITSVDAGGSQLRVAVAMDAINRLLFAINSTGFLSLDVSELFFNRVGFDFVEECDAFVESGGESAEAYSPLCSIRPRVSELLGTPLTRYDYFPAKHPLMIRVRGNRALPPHISVVNEEEIPIVVHDQQNGGTSGEELGPNLLDVQIGGLVMSFYALEVDDSGEVDKYGNLPIKLDSQGKPVIHSMRPEDPDPSNGQIATFEATLLLAVEIGNVETDPNDPSRFEIMVRLLADRSRLVISPVAGSNSTTIPPAALISALREKIQYAINIYSSKEEAIKIPIPKSVSFDDYRDNDLIKLLGLKTLAFGPKGFQLSLDEESNSLSVGISAAITQLLHQGGAEFQDTLPH